MPLHPITCTASSPGARCCCSPTPPAPQASRRESETLTKFAADFGCRAYGNYEAMADDEEVDIVYVNTIHPTHHALAKMALEAGKHVLVEKPFTMNHREAADLATLAAEKGLFLMEAMCALSASLLAPAASARPLYRCCL